MAPYCMTVVRNRSGETVVRIRSGGTVVHIMSAGINLGATAFRRAPA